MEVAQERRRLLLRARTLIAVTKGSVLSTAGDGFIAEFQAAEEALRFAAQLASEATSGAAGSLLSPLPLRIGIDTGEPKSFSTLGADEKTTVALHRASRLCTAAADDEIIVSSLTHDLVEPLHVFKFSNRRRVQAKGFPLLDCLTFEYGELKRAPVATTARLRRIADYHAGLLDSYRRMLQPRTWLTSGWGSEESQSARFAALVRATYYDGGTVLDFGCGAGGLFDYLVHTTPPSYYLGVDQLSGILDLAIELHGPFFEVVDQLWRPERAFDFVFASGVFQFADVEQPFYYRDLILRLLPWARVSLAVNFLSDLRSQDQRSDVELYVNPAEIVSFARELGLPWCIDHSYHPGLGDFTVAFFPTSSKPWNRPGFTYSTGHAVRERLNSGQGQEEE